MSSIVRSVIDVAIEWGVPAALAGASAWAAVKRRAIRDRWSKRRQRRES